MKNLNITRYFFRENFINFAVSELHSGEEH